MSRVDRICRSLAGLTKRAGALPACVVAVPAALASPGPNRPDVTARVRLGRKRGLSAHGCRGFRFGLCEGR